MKFAKSIATGTGAVVLAGLILALLAPKAVHAIAATAVQVVNTTSSPVLNKDTERDARIPYESKSIQSCPSASSCQFYFSPVPAGYRLIVQSVVADLIVAGPTPPYGRMEGDDSVNTIWVLTGGVVGPQIAQNAFLAGFNQSIAGYVDPGYNPALVVTRVLVPMRKPQS